jgi:hypothetical protein
VLQQSEKAFSSLSPAVVSVFLYLYIFCIIGVYCKEKISKRQLFIDFLDRKNHPLDGFAYSPYA